MNTFAKTILGTALVLSFAAPALADPAVTTLEERNVYLFHDGKMVSMKTADPTHALIMKEFKPMKSGTMVYFSGGKFYMAENKKMAGGKMMHADIYGSDMGHPDGW